MLRTDPVNAKLGGRWAIAARKGDMRGAPPGNRPKLGGSRGLAESLSFSSSASWSRLAFALRFWNHILTCKSTRFILAGKNCEIIAADCECEMGTWTFITINSDSVIVFIYGKGIFKQLIYNNLAISLLIRSDNISGNNSHLIDFIFGVMALGNQEKLVMEKMDFYHKKPAACF